MDMRLIVLRNWRREDGNWRAEIGGWVRIWRGRVEMNGRENTRDIRRGPDSRRQSWRKEGRMRIRGRVGGRGRRGRMIDIHLPRWRPWSIIIRVPRVHWRSGPRGWRRRQRETRLAPVGSYIRVEVSRRCRGDMKRRRAKGSRIEWRRCWMRRRMGIVEVSDLGALKAMRMAIIAPSAVVAPWIVGQLDCRRSNQGQHVV
jgi:hypothetical protein